jgi:hypothetical protein
MLQKLSQKQVHVRIINSPTYPVSLESSSPWLLDLCSRHMRTNLWSEHSAFTSTSCFILDCYFTWTSLCCVYNAYPDMEVRLILWCLTTDWTTGVWTPAEVRGFFCSLCVQTGSEVHPASCTMSTGDPFLGVKRGRGVTLTIHPHLLPRSKMSRSYTSSLSKRFRGV